MKKKKKEQALTKREKELYKHYKLEGNGKIVAEHFKISHRTFESHMRNIHLKTNTHSPVDLFEFEKENPALFDDNE